MGLMDKAKNAVEDLTGKADLKDAGEKVKDAFDN